MRLFFGVSFSFRTFRVHSISTVVNRMLDDLELDTTCSVVQYEKHIRTLLDRVAERLSNHSDRDTVIYYTDLRIFLAKALKIEIRIQDLGALRRLYENNRQEVGWAGDWLEYLLDKFGDRPIPIEFIQRLCIY